MRLLLPLLVLTSAALAQPVAPEPVPAPITWSGHIASIVYQSCTPCHRPGEAAPFDLMSYDDCKRRARMIARVTKSRLMPPWHPVPGHGEFDDCLRLPDNQVAAFQEWAKAGAPRGDSKAEPKLPDYPEGWALGNPDLVVSMKEGYPIPADGPDIYRNFVIPVNLGEDMWITAIEIRPSEPSVVHHCLFFSDDTGEARATEERSRRRTGKPGYRGMGRRAGTLGGWAVGGQPKHLPLNLAYPFPQHSDLVLAMHFHPTGKAEVEKTTIGFHFAKKAPKRTILGFMVPPIYGITAGLDIPAGEKDFRIRGKITLPVDTDVVSVGGHAHYLGRKMHAEATLPNGQKRSLFRIDEWAFDWQNRYIYKRPVRLPAGTVVEGWISYDNSKDNPNNQYSPPRRVRWGRESTDEMGAIMFACVAAKESETGRLRSGIRLGMFAGRGNAQMGRFAARLIERVKGYDENGDGILKKDELPGRMSQFLGFFDLDADGMIDKEEFKALEERFGGDGNERGGRGGRRGGGN
ncbi:MAG: hypothetical protein CMJ83_16350 [Planctomycetes bacterium]|nr:hypothetical protein [Planctomycetota bacterium]